MKAASLGNLSQRQALAMVCLAGVFFIGLTVPYVFTLHATFKTSIMDIGNYVQAFTRLLAGKGLSVTIAPLYVEQPWFAVHFSPILFLLVPFYALWPAPETLRIINVLLLSSAALPIYFVAWRVTQHRWFSVVLSASYLCSPFVFNAAIWDFHETAFAPLFFSLGYLALLHKNKRCFVACCLLLLCVKEHYGIAVAGFGLLWAIVHKDYRFGAILAALGVSTAMVLVGILMPSLIPKGVHFMMLSGERYEWIKDPWQHMQLIVILALNAVPYLFFLSFCGFFVALTSPIWLLPGLADLGANLLSLSEMMRSPYSYHTAPLAAIFTLAVAPASARFIKNRPNLMYRDIAYTCVFVIGALAANFWALPYCNNIWEFSVAPQLSESEKDTKAMRDIREMVPIDARIATQSNVGAHFGDYLTLYAFPEKTQDIDWVMLRLRFPYQLSDGVFGSPFGRPCDVFVRGVSTMLEKQNWKIVYWNEPWLLLHIDSPKDVIPNRAPVWDSLRRLQETCPKAKGVKKE